MTSLTQITSEQAGKEVTANENLAAVSPAALFSKRVPGTTGLTWAYYGGTFTKADGTRVQIANGTITLTASSTLYIQANQADGVVSAVTGAFTAGYLPLYKVVTGKASVTSIEDWREFATRTHAHTIPDVTGLQTSLDAKQPLDADLSAIAGLAGTSGVLRKTAADTWTLASATASGLVLLGAADVAAQRSSLGLVNHEKVTVDASGNLGLGVPPSAWATVLPVLQINNASITGYNNQAILSSNWYYNAGNKYVASGHATQYSQSSGQHAWYTAPSGTAGSAINFTQAMTLDATGKLGVGESSPATELVVRKDNAGGLGPVLALINITPSTVGSSAAINFGLEASTYDGVDCNVQLKAVVNNTTSAADFVISTWNGAAVGERLRLHSSGRLLLGNATDDGVTLLQCAGSAYIAGDFLIGTTYNAAQAARFSMGFPGGSEKYGMVFRPAVDNTFPLIFTNATGTTIGSVSTTGTVTAFNTSSDRRLKSNITTAADAGMLLDAVQIVSHDWKAGGHARYGVIAQDLHAVFPEAVTEGDTGEEINRAWAVDYSKLVAPMLLEIQSLRRRVKQLEAA